MMLPVDVDEWSYRLVPGFHLLLMATMFIPTAIAHRHPRGAVFYFLTTIVSATCSLPLVTAFAPQVALIPASAMVASALTLLHHRREAVGEPVTWQPALLLAMVVGTSLIFWTEFRHAVPTGVQLRPPLAGPIAVRQGGVTPLFNGHVVAQMQRWAVDLSRPMGFADVLAHLQGRSEATSSFGIPVYAPCAGEVLFARDGLADQPIGKLLAEVPPGNLVVLHCDRTEPAAIIRLAHLKGGSVRVAPGAHVVAGDIVAELGNTGNSTTPHLHIDAQTVVHKGRDPGEPLAIYIDGEFLRRHSIVEFPSPRTEPKPRRRTSLPPAGAPGAHF